MEQVPEGFEIDLFTSLTQPILFGGVPRTFAILNGTMTAIVCLPLGLPLLGLPFGLAVHGVAAWMTRRDAYFFETLMRHLRQEPYWD